MIYENLMKIEIRIEGYCVNLRVKIFALRGNIYFPFPPIQKFKLEQPTNENDIHVCALLLK